eukprot:6947149-Pyramimonas_sp.AAC.1
MVGSRCAPPAAPVDVKGNHVDVKGNHVDVKDNHVDVKGNHVDVKGNHVDVKGNSVPRAWAAATWRSFGRIRSPCPCPSAPAAYLADDLAHRAQSRAYTSAHTITGLVSKGANGAGESGGGPCR